VGREYISIIDIIDIKAVMHTYVRVECIQDILKINESNESFFFERLYASFELSKPAFA
jgi:hypothetical protein